MSPNEDSEPWGAAPQRGDDDGGGREGAEKKVPDKWKSTCLANEKMPKLQGMYCSTQCPGIEPEPGIEFGGIASLLVRRSLKYRSPPISGCLSPNNCLLLNAIVV
uniref:Uncharacterized protein n=1 Tax=Globodera rostochiensis TaxID=31243 RepID=A0A914HJE2_GLORO